MASKDIEAGRAYVLIQLRDKVTAGLQHVERSFASFGRNFATLGTAMAAAGGAALAWPLKVSSDMENLGVQFEVLLGSADASKEMLLQLSDFAKRTPFSMQDAAENAQLLLNYGMSAGQILPTLQALGDVSAGNREKFHRLALAFGQTQAKGRLMGQEVLQMTEAGFNPLQQISQMTGKSVRQLTDEMENGGISAQMVAAAFQAAAGPGGRFNGMMDKMSGTMTGLLSTLIDAVSMGLKPIGDAAASVLKPLAKFAIGAASAFQAFAERNQRLLRIVAMVLLGLVAVGGVIAGIGFAAIALSTIFGALATITSAIAGAIGFLFSPLGAVLVTLTAAAVAAWYFKDAIAAMAAPVVSALQPVVSAIQEIWSVFSTAFGGIVEALMRGDLQSAAGIAWAGFVAVAWTAIEQLGAAINMGLDFLQTWIPGVSAVRDFMQQAFGGIGNAILAGRWDLAGQIAMAKLQLVWMSGIDILKDAWEIFVAGNKMAFRTLADFITDVWNGAVNGISKGITWIMEKLGMAAEGAVQELERMQKAEDKARQKERNGRDNPIETMANRMMQREQKRNAQSAKIRDLEAQAAKAREDSGATVGTVAATARADLDKAIKASQDFAKKEEPTAAKDLGNQVSMGNQAAGKIASLGTFSGAAAGQALGINNRPNEETAANTRKMRTLMERQRPGQAAFG